MSGLRALKRGLNAARRLLKGLRLKAENVSPECPNDLFQAHAAIYQFASPYTVGRRVLDLGCGTGYGSALLLDAGARCVLGLDLDPANIRYARRHYRGRGLEFGVADAQRLPDSCGPFEAVVSSNVFEHLAEPSVAIAGVASRLVEGGAFVLAVPPIVDSTSLAENRRNPFHRSNLFAGEWHSRLSHHFRSVRTFHQSPPEGVILDFSSPFASTVRPEEFRFSEVAPERFGSEPTLTALFVCSGRSLPAQLEGATPALPQG